MESAGSVLAAGPALVSDGSNASGRSALVNGIVRVIAEERLPISRFFIECSASTVLPSLGIRGVVGQDVVRCCRKSGLGLFDGKN